MRRFLIPATALLVGAFLAPTAALAAKPQRVEVCHFDDDTGESKLISLPQRAADAHLANHEHDMLAVDENCETSNTPPEASSFSESLFAGGAREVDLSSHAFDAEQDATTLEYTTSFSGDTEAFVVTPGPEPYLINVMCDFSVESAVMVLDWFVQDLGGLMSPLASVEFVCTGLPG